VIQLRRHLSLKLALLARNCRRATPDVELGLVWVTGSWEHRQMIRSSPGLLCPGKETAGEIIKGAVIMRNKYSNLCLVGIRRGLRTKRPIKQRQSSHERQRETKSKRNKSKRINNNHYGLHETKSEKVRGLPAFRDASSRRRQLTSLYATATDQIRMKIQKVEARRNRGHGDWKVQRPASEASEQSPTLLILENP